jgi:hypothetical protein
VEDDTNYHRAAMIVAKRGLIVAIVSLAVTVLALGYTIFADFGGVEWTKNAAGGWFDESSGTPQDAETADADAGTTSEASPAGTDGDAEDSGSDEADGNLFAVLGRWLKGDLPGEFLEPGLPFWTTFEQMVLMGIVYMTGSLVAKLLFRRDASEESLGSWFLVDSTVVVVLMLWAAFVVGEGFVNTALMVGTALLQAVVWAVLGFVLLMAIIPGAEQTSTPTQE